MTGWKTYVGAAIVGLTAILSYFGHTEFTEVCYGIGAALGITGLRHRMDRNA